MSDTYHSQNLAAGYLPTVKAPIFSAASGQRVIVKAITCVNKDDNTRTINLYLNINGTSYPIAPYNMQLGSRYRTIDDSVHMMSDGDSIEGDCDVANKVAFVIDGAISE